jgi:hypothetical protein
MADCFSRFKTLKKQNDEIQNTEQQESDFKIQDQTCMSVREITRVQFRNNSRTSPSTQNERNLCDATTSEFEFDRSIPIGTGDGQYL